MPTAEEMNEFREDLMMENKQEEYHQCMMRTDWDYVMEYLCKDIETHEIRDAYKTVKAYGWEIDFCSFVEEIL